MSFRPPAALLVRHKRRMQEMASTDQSLSPREIDKHNNENKDRRNQLVQNTQTATSAIATASEAFRIVVEALGAIGGGAGAIGASAGAADEDEAGARSIGRARTAVDLASNYAKMASDYVDIVMDHIDDVANAFANNTLLDGQQQTMFDPDEVVVGRYEDPRSAFSSLLVDCVPSEHKTIPVDVDGGGGSGSGSVSCNSMRSVIFEHGPGVQLVDSDNAKLCSFCRKFCYGGEMRWVNIDTGERMCIRCCSLQSVTAREPRTVPTYLISRVGLEAYVSICSSTIRLCKTTSPCCCKKCSRRLPTEIKAWHDMNTGDASINFCVKCVDFVPAVSRDEEKAPARCHSARFDSITGEITVTNTNIDISRAIRNQCGEKNLIVVSPQKTVGMIAFCGTIATYLYCVQVL
jgi:hypothetical protein